MCGRGGGGGAAAPAEQREVVGGRCAAGRPTGWPRRCAVLCGRASSGGWGRFGGEELGGGPARPRRVPPVHTGLMGRSGRRVRTLCPPPSLSFAGSAPGPHRALPPSESGFLLFFFVPHAPGAAAEGQYSPPRPPRRAPRALRCMYNTSIEDRSPCRCLWCGERWHSAEAVLRGTRGRRPPLWRGTGRATAGIVPSPSFRLDFFFFFLTLTSCQGAQ